jgi:hypothetical protein
MKALDHVANTIQRRSSPAPWVHKKTTTLKSALLVSRGSQVTGNDNVNIEGNAPVGFKRANIVFGNIGRDRRFTHQVAGEC